MPNRGQAITWLCSPRSLTLGRMSKKKLNTLFTYLYLYQFFNLRFFCRTKYSSVRISCTQWEQTHMICIKHDFYIWDCLIWGNILKSRKQLACWNKSITNLRLRSHFPGANDLDSKDCYFFVCASSPHHHGPLFHTWYCMKCNNCEVKS